MGVLPDWKWYGRPDFRGFFSPAGWAGWRELLENPVEYVFHWGVWVGTRFRLLTPPTTAR
ncbi:hypothetical protein GCM10022224_031520 [Nonomuraea antimicrobica]|uniref:Uncharacterized protein n=1 Tax=Nonomuraea antimicrobica TaxID=561173 RepID=A0ABP7BMS7_9ACTN